MSLQFDSLRAFIKTGAIYDDENPIIKNIVYDVDRANHALERENIKNLFEISKLKSCRWVEMYRPEIDQYCKYLDRLSEELFDNFKYVRVETDEQVEWKEYFHSLYELIVVDVDEDRPDTTTSLLFQELYKHWDTFTEPKHLKPKDKLYPIVESIRRKFRDLKTAHYEFTKYDSKQTIINNHFKDVAIRKKHNSLLRSIDNNDRILDAYSEILRWAKK